MLDSGTDGVDVVGMLKIFGDCDNVEEVGIGLVDDDGVVVLS